MKYIKTTLGDVSIGKGQYGIGASAVEYSDDLYTYLRITDINDDGTLNVSDLKSVDDEKAEQYLLKPNDIVFARTGNSTGRNYFYDGTDGVFVYAGFLIKFSIDPSKVNPKYVKYYCLSDEYKGWVQSHSTGSTRGNINAQTYASMEIILPPRAQQDKLVSILEKLELKRKNNAAINRNLYEQMDLQWVSIFEHTPTDVSLGDVVRTTSGGTPSRKNDDFYVDGEIYWVKSKELNGSYIIDTEEKITELAIQKSAAKPIPANSTLIAMYGATVGEFGIISDEMTCNQAICALVPNENYPSSYLFELAKQSKEKLINMAIGSAQQNISQVLIKQLQIHSDKSKIERYAAIAEPIMKTIEKNIKENSCLSKLRDSLLPKLMSGELDVSDLDI